LRGAEQGADKLCEIVGRGDSAELAAGRRQCLLVGACVAFGARDAFEDTGQCAVHLRAEMGNGCFEARRQMLLAYGIESGWTDRTPGSDQGIDGALQLRLAAGTVRMEYRKVVRRGLDVELRHQRDRVARELPLLVGSLIQAPSPMRQAPQPQVQGPCNKRW